MMKGDEYIDYIQLHTVFPKIIKMTSREFNLKERAKPSIKNNCTDVY